MGGGLYYTYTAYHVELPTLNTARAADAVGAFKKKTIKTTLINTKDTIEPKELNYLRRVI